MNVIDPHKLYELDYHKWVVNMVHVGNSKNRIVTIKNFFKCPDQLKDYATSLDFVDTMQGQVTAIPGFVHKIGNGEIALKKPIVDFATDAFKVTEPFNVDGNHDFTFQVYPTTESRKCSFFSLYPHVDNRRYAGVCSLSTEYSGDDNGTAFWRSKITGEEHIAKDFNYRQMGEHSGFIPHGETLLDPSSVTINNWERYYLAKHEYNTMVMYEGNVWHSPYFDASKWSGDRTTFNCFLD